MPKLDPPCTEGRPDEKNALEGRANQTQAAGLGFVISPL